MVSRSGEAVAFLTDGEGRVLEASGGGRKATFHYNASGHLILATNTAGTPFAYTYDDLYNLTEIRYEDGTRLTVEYDPASNRVRRLTRPHGRELVYDYGYALTESGYPDYDRYYTRVLSTDPEGATTEALHEWVMGTRTDGTRYRVRYTFTLDGEVREVGNGGARDG